MQQMEVHWAARATSLSSFEMRAIPRKTATAGWVTDLQRANAHGFAKVLKTKLGPSELIVPWETTLADESSSPPSRVEVKTYVSRVFPVMLC